MTTTYITDEQRAAVLLGLLRDLTPAGLADYLWLSVADVQTTDGEEALAALYARLAETTMTELAEYSRDERIPHRLPRILMDSTITATRWVSETVHMLSVGVNYWEPRPLVNALIAAVTYHEMLINMLGKPLANLPAVREAAFAPLGLTTY